jgi:hypothetical protein
MGKGAESGSKAKGAARHAAVSRPELGSEGYAAKLQPNCFLQAETEGRITQLAGVL